MKGEYFTTYSEKVKWNTLVDDYSFPGENIFVIPHAPNSLSSHIEIKGFPNIEATKINFCKIQNFANIEPLKAYNEVSTIATFAKVKKMN